MVNLDQRLSIQDYLVKAQQYAEADKADLVGETLSDGVEKHPESVELLSHYAFFCWKMGDLVQAETLFQKRNQLIEPDAETCLLLSRLYEELGITEQVQHWLERSSKQKQLRLRDKLRYWKAVGVNHTKQFYSTWGNIWFVNQFSSMIFWICSQTSIFIVLWIELAFPSLVKTKNHSTSFSFGSFLRFLWNYDPDFIHSKLAYHKCREIILTSQCLPKIHSASILDIGTGENPLVLYWASMGYSVTALDGSAYGCAHLDQIKKELERKQYFIDFKYVVGDMCELPIADHSYDVVTAICAIEHLPDDGDSQCMLEIFRVLKHGGTAIITIETSGIYSEDWMRVPYERGYQIGKENEVIQSWQEVFCRNYTIHEIQSRLIGHANWKETEIGFYDDFNFPIRSWTDPLQHKIMPIFFQPFIPFLSCLFYRKRNFSSELSPSSIGYIILQKPE